MKYFKGKIDDKVLSDFRRYDNALTKHKDRLNYINELLNDSNNNFMSEYFSNYYNANINKDGELSENDVVCKALESLGTYLIESQDIQSNRKVKYRFWVDQKEYNKYKESRNITSSAFETSDEDNNTDIMDMFVDKKNDINQKIVGNISIEKEDIKKIDDIKLLQDVIDSINSKSIIQSIKDNCSKLLEDEKLDSKYKNKIKYIINNTERYVSSYTKDLKENQIIIKETICKPTVFKNPLRDKGIGVDWANILNFKSVKCVKAILKYLPLMDLSGEDLQIILWDFYNFLINNLKLSKKEKQIVELFSLGINQSEMCEILDMKKNSVSNTVNRIVYKVVKSEYKVEQ